MNAFRRNLEPLIPAVGRYSPALTRTVRSQMVSFWTALSWRRAPDDCLSGPIPRGALPTFNGIGDHDDD
jgi:hypothetical protein